MKKLRSRREDPATLRALVDRISLTLEFFDLLHRYVLKNVVALLATRASHVDADDQRDPLPLLLAVFALGHRLIIHAYRHNRPTQMTKIDV